MANYDTNRINVNAIKQYYSSFVVEKENYGNITYHIFLNSYLNNCGDLYVNNITNKLRKKYEEINFGYKNISSWWASYNDGIVMIESNLINAYDNSVDSSSSILLSNINENVGMQQFIDSLSSTATPPNIISFINTALIGVLNSGCDANAKIIANNLYKIYNLVPDLKFNYGSESEYLNPSQQMNLSEDDVGSKYYFVFYHELGHLLDFNFVGESMDFYYEDCVQYQSDAMNDPEKREKLYNLMKTISDKYNGIYHNLRFGKVGLEVGNNIREEVKTKDFDTLVNELYGYFNDDPERDSLGFEGKSREKIEDLYLKNKRAEIVHEIADKNYYLTADSAADSLVSDIISAMTLGENKVDFDGENISLIYYHSSAYFSNNYCDVYNEQMADFIGLKMLGRQDRLDQLKEIYGSEWYDFLNEEYESDALALQDIE